MTSAEHGGAARVDAILARAALTQPLRACVVQGRQSWTYAEVHERACRLAGALAALGVRKGDRVALWTTNRPEFVEVFFGVPMLGAIAAPLDFWWNWQDAHGALAQIRPQVLIVGAAQALVAAQSRAAIKAAGIEHVLCLDEPPVNSELDSYADLLAAASPLTRPISVPAWNGSSPNDRAARHPVGGSLFAVALRVRHAGIQGESVARKQVPDIVADSEPHLTLNDTRL